MKEYTFKVSASVTVRTDGDEAEARRLLATGDVCDDVCIGPECGVYLSGTALEKAELEEVYSPEWRNPVSDAA